MVTLWDIKLLSLSMQACIAMQAGCIRYGARGTRTCAVGKTTVSPFIAGFHVTQMSRIIILLTCWFDCK